MIRERIQQSIDRIVTQRGENVVYRRQRRSVTLCIVPAGTERRSDSIPTGGGYFEKTFYRFLVQKEKLFFGPRTPFLPEPNDTFERNGRLYRVCIFQGEAAWKDNDLYDVSIEFHAEEIQSARKKTTRKSGTRKVEEGTDETGEGFFSP